MGFFLHKVSKDCTCLNIQKKLFIIAENYKTNLVILVTGICKTLHLYQYLTWANQFKRITILIRHNTCDMYQQLIINLYDPADIEKFGLK